MNKITVAQEGFYGIYHAPVKNCDPSKAVIVVGGSEGNENIPMNVGAMFARCGIAALGICYWNVEGLPKELVRVPVDPFEKAILWLKNKGYEKIIMYGISKGAELALLCASLMPDICGVVALSPMHCIWGGMHGNKSMASKTFSSASEFTYRGKDFPFMTADLKYGPAIRNLILHQQFELSYILSYIYEEPLKHFDENTAIRVDTGMEVFEIVGTGGDNAHSFNISTTSALVCAAGGMKVAKHGNRAASSKCGTADCLEALGVNIEQSPGQCVRLLEETGICFFFAQKYHTSMKYVGAIRKELGFRTVFNILGPLTNPASPSMQLLGVYDEYLVGPLAQVLINLGVRRGMVVYGQDKLDEISVSAPTTVCEIKDGWYKMYQVTPEDFGLQRCRREDLAGGTPGENAEITRKFLHGEGGPKRDAVLMNAGASLYIGGKAKSWKDGIRLAGELIDSGKATETLQKLIEISNQPQEEP